MTHKHWIEELVDLCVESFNLTVKDLITYLSDDHGRPIFSKMLTDEEKLTFWNSPEIRPQVENKVYAIDGERGLYKYRSAMMALQDRVNKKMLEAQGIVKGGI